MSAPAPLTLALHSVSVGYGARAVIRDLSLAQPLQGGVMTALVGPNAAGKTTLLRALAGLHPARGSVRLDGLELLGHHGPARTARIGYMPQTLPQRVALTVFEATLGALRAAPARNDDPRSAPEQVRDTLEALGLGPLAFRGLDQLSGGQRQMASLAQAVVRAPVVLLLDEPTSALDLNAQFRVMTQVRSIVRDRGIIAVVVVHDLALACRWCERIVVLSQGRVVADGAPGEAITPDSLARVYGVQGRVETCSRGGLQVLVDGLLDQG